MAAVMASRSGARHDSKRGVAEVVGTVFGVPRVREDDALRAIRAAVEMQAEVAGIGIGARIGVNTGQVIAHAGESLITGDAVNVGAGLEQAASVGEILIGAPTHDLVRGLER